MSSFSGIFQNYCVDFAPSWGCFFFCFFVKYKKNKKHGKDADFQRTCHVSYSTEGGGYRMPLRVADWYDAVREYEVKLIAGRAGLNLSVHRVHIIEKPEFSEFLEGNEIIFVTGVALSSPEELNEIIQNCYKAGVVSVVVNVGNYISAIPQEAIDFSNQYALPLFVVPWHIHIELLMQKVFQMMENESSDKIELETLLSNAIRFPDRQELYVSGLQQKGFRPEWHYCVALIHLELDPGNTNVAETQESMLQVVRGVLSDRSCRGFAYLFNQTLVLLFANYSSEDVEELMKELTEDLQNEVQVLGRLFFSVGRCTKSVRCIQKSFVLAEKILTLQLGGQLPVSLHAYNNLGIYKIVLGLENQDILNEIHEEYLAPLISYDRACGTEYVDFIQNYLKYDGHIRAISEKMFIHRNTVHYKIRKIEEILDCDLQRTDTKMYLLIAVMSYQIHPRQD